MHDGGELPRDTGIGDRVDRQLARVGLTRARAIGLTKGFAIAFGGAALFILVNMPLPWFLGALTACLVASVAGVDYDRPVELSVAMRAILGVAVGTAFTPELLARFGSMSLSLALVFPFMIAVMGLGMLYFERVARYDRPTAFFCAVPGGLTDMVTMAEDAGANPRTVTLTQATRIVLIVFLLPIWLKFAGGRTIGVFVPGAAHFHQLLVVDALVLFGLGWGGWKLASWLKLAGAPLVGPMILSGLAHAAGLTEAKIPLELLILAQVTLGILLGAQFRGLTWREFSSTMAWGAGFSLLLVIFTGLVALCGVVAHRFRQHHGAARLCAGRPVRAQPAGVHPRPRRRLHRLASSGAAGDRDLRRPAGVQGQSEMARAARLTCRPLRRRQLVSITKSVPLPVSGLMPRSETISDEPGTSMRRDAIAHVLRDLQAVERGTGGQLRRSDRLLRLAPTLFGALVDRLHLVVGEADDGQRRPVHFVGSRLIGDAR